MSRHSNPNPYAACVYSEAYEVDLQLARRFGLTRDVFVDAALKGDGQRRLATHDDPDGTDGFNFWTRSTRALRVNARRAGWHNEKYQQIAATFNNDESVAIAVSRGDDKTGRLGDDPKTRTVKHGGTLAAVEQNRLPYGRDDGEPGVDFWYLLVDASDEGVWAEVSRPLDASGGVVDQWQYRIVLAECTPDGGARRKDSTEPIVPKSNIHVPVSRKAA